MLMRLTDTVVGAAILLLLVGPARAAEPAGTFPHDSADPPTTASLRAALLYGTPSAEGPALQVAGERSRSVPLAFALSAAVPGLGQAYNRQWIKAAAVAAVEVALWTGYLTWRGQGRSERDAYWAYAHEHWSPARYATWLNDFRTFLIDERGRSIATGPVDVASVSTIDFSNPDGWSSAERAQVRAMFEEIRALESDAGVVHPETNASFSHKLPYFAEQQYYELIGKYFQFAPGWDDYGAWVMPDGSFTHRIDPEMTGDDGSKPNVSDRFFEYARDHAHANDLLRRASRMTSLFVINHVLAAFDATINAKLHNNRIETQLTFGYDAAGEVVPRASLHVRL